MSTINEFVERCGTTDDAAASRQHDPNDREPPAYVQQRAHRTMDGPETSTLVAHPDRSECWCADCDARLTIGSKEYGHAKDCEHYCWRGE